MKLYMNIDSSILGPLSASHGHWMPQVVSVITTSQISEAPSLPAQSPSTDELGSTSPGPGSASESGCSLIHTHLSKLLGIRIREPSPLKRFLHACCLPNV